MPGSTDLAFAAIRAVLKLADAARSAWIDSTRRRELTLPLPPTELSSSAAVQWFSTRGTAAVQGDSDLARTYREATTGPLADREKAATALLPYYLEYWNADRAARGLSVDLGGTALAPDEWSAMFRVRQLSRGEDAAADRTLLSRTLGTIVEVGIEVFSATPLAARRDSRSGQILAAVLDALDRVDLAGVDAGREGWLEDLAGRLVVGALETVGDQPELLARDDRVRELIGVAAKAVAEDAVARAGDGTYAKISMGEWAETVFRGLVRGAGAKVLEQPDRYLGISDAARGALVQQAGGAVLSLLTTDTGLDIRAVVSRDGVEKILGAALEAAAEHPEVFGVEGNAGLTRILGEVAGALAEYPKLVSTDVLPEIARLLLERTGENLELLWPGGAEDPKKHLLLVAVKSTLAALSAGASDGGAWKLRFGSADVLDVVESVVDDLAANPAWLLSGAGKIEEGLATAITATLAVIRKRGDAKLFSPAIASAVLRAAVTAVATRREFLALPGGAGKPIVAAAVDVVLSAILDPDLDLDAKWQLLRDESVVGAVSLSLEVLGDTTVTSEGVERLRGVWEDVVDDLKEGGALDFDKIEAELRAAL